MLEVIKKEWFILLPILALASIPFGRSVEIFVLIMAITGAVDLAKNHNNIRQNYAFRFFSIFFLLFWVPALLSLIDAVNFERTLKTVVGMPRFYLAGIFIISRISSSEQHIKVALSFATIVSFWAIDGWIQSLFGTDLLGFSAPYDNRVSGIFGENARLGLMIVPFFAVSTLIIKQKYGFNLALIVSLLLSSAIVISGDRAAWVSLVVIFLIFLVIYGKKLKALKALHYAFIVILISVATITISKTSAFQQRLSTVTVGFDGSYDAINKASSARLPLWICAYNMFEANPVNGVGVRSFRYAYPEYATESDPFINYALPEEQRLGQTHAHQVVLEFAADTGIIGVIAYIIALLLIYGRLLPLAYKNNTVSSMGYVISLIMIFFPFNTHQSFYSSHWGQIVWMILALALSALAAEVGNNKLMALKQVK